MSHGFDDALDPLGENDTWIHGAGFDAADEKFSAAAFEELEATALQLVAEALRKLKEMISGILNGPTEKNHEG